MRKRDADVVGFVQGLVSGLTGSAPDISKCIPDFEQTLTDAQTAVNTLNAGFQSESISEVGNGRHQLHPHFISHTVLV
jgi:hypothetical protein